MTNICNICGCEKEKYHTQKHHQFGRPPWNRGVPCAEETKKKLSDANKNPSEATRNKMSLAKRGKHISPKTEFKKGTIPWNKEIKNSVSEGGKKSISDANKGHIPWNKGTKGVMKAWNKGIPCTPEEAERLRKIRVGRKQPPDAVRRTILGHLGKKRPKEVCEKISRSRKGIKFSREHREKLSKALKGKPSWNKGKESWVKGDKHPLWRGGISYIPYCPKFSNRLKERIRDRDNRTCQLCGLKENGEKLSVHHLNYDKPNCDPDLIALCHSCHSKVNYNRDYYKELFIKKLEERGLLCSQNAKSSQSN